MSLSRQSIVTRVQSFAGPATRPLSATAGTRRGLDEARGKAPHRKLRHEAGPQRSVRRSARLLNTNCSTPRPSVLRAVRGMAHHRTVAHATAFNAPRGTRQGLSAQPAKRGHARPGRFVKAADGRWSHLLV